MDNYIPSEIEGLIAATSKLKDALRHAGTRWDMKCVKDLRGEFMESRQLDNYIWG